MYIFSNFIKCLKSLDLNYFFVYVSSFAKVIYFFAIFLYLSNTLDNNWPSIALAITVAEFTSILVESGFPIIATKLIATNIHKDIVKKKVTVSCSIEKMSLNTSKASWLDGLA